MNFPSFLAFISVAFLSFDMLTLELIATKDLEAFQKTLADARTMLSDSSMSKFVSLADKKRLRERRHTIDEMLANFADETGHGLEAKSPVPRNLDLQNDESRLRDSKDAFKKAVDEQTMLNKEPIKEELKFLQKSPRSEGISCSNANSSYHQMQRVLEKGIRGHGLSHEADYKLSQIEQDAAENQRRGNLSYTRKENRAIAKRTMPFNAMSQIKLKTSHRLMLKGYGALLPSSVLMDRKQRFLKGGVPFFALASDGIDLGEAKFKNYDDRLGSLWLNGRGPLRKRKCRLPNESHNVLAIDEHSPMDFDLRPKEDVFKEETPFRSKRRQRRSLDLDEVKVANSSSESNEQRSSKEVDLCKTKVNEAVPQNTSPIESLVSTSTKKVPTDLTGILVSDHTTSRSPAEHDLGKRSVNDSNYAQGKAANLTPRNQVSAYASDESSDADGLAREFPNDQFDNIKDNHYYRIRQPNFDKFSGNLTSSWFPNANDKIETRSDNAQEDLSIAALRKGLFGGYSKKKTSEKKGKTKKPSKSEKKKSGGKKGSKDKDNQLTVVLYDEVLNCTSLSTLEDYLKAIKANKSRESTVTKDKISVDIENTEGSGGDESLSTKCSSAKPTKENPQKDTVKLNIAINGLLLNQKKEKKFFGNGTIHLQADEERGRRALENSRAVNDPETDFSDAGRQSLDLVQSIFDHIKSHPTLTVLWPSLQGSHKRMLRHQPLSGCTDRKLDKTSKAASIESLMRQAMRMVHEIIEKEVSKRICKALTPELRAFYEMILRIHASHDQCRGRRSNLPEAFGEIDHENEHGRAKVSVQQLGKYDCLSAYRKRHILSKNTNLPKPSTLLSQLNKALAHFHHEPQRKREIFQDSNSEHIQKYESQFTPAFVKLLKASQQFPRMP